MSSARKKVIVRTVEDALYTGYLSLTGIVAEGQVELLDVDGRMTPIVLDTIHWIAFVRDFNLSDRVDPERLSRRAFLARPRTEGLWVRLTLRRGDLLEGLAPLDRSLLDGLVDDRGLFLIPADVRSNTQRLYVPRSAIEALQLLAVITNPSKAKPASREASAPAQPSLFAEPQTG